MDKPRTLVECATPEEVGRALYEGYSITCSEEVVEQCGAAFDEEGIDAFTLEEILEAVERPYGDREPLAEARESLAPLLRGDSRRAPN